MNSPSDTALQALAELEIAEKALAITSKTKFVDHLPTTRMQNVPSTVMGAGLSSSQSVAVLHSSTKIPLQPNKAPKWIRAGPASRALIQNESQVKAKLPR